MQSNPDLRTRAIQHGAELLQRWIACRTRSVELAEPLSDADATVQSMPDTSPTKWHLAHTTWFLEEFILKKYLRSYRAFDPGYGFLFNSYYEAVGARHPRPLRGLLTRPSLVEIYAYRKHVDHFLKEQLETGVLPDEALQLVELGINHEEQHQELLLTDILHLFAQNPLRPSYIRQAHLSRVAQTPRANRWVDFEGGIFSFGHDAQGFAFDSETPRHEVLLRPFALCARPVSNRQWLDFVKAGGYRDSQWWLSDGWRTVQEQDWQAPLYWEERDDAWWHMTLAGMMPLELDAPVSHISFYEADAYARFVGARLPTEFEWEHAAVRQAVQGNFVESKRLNPESGNEDGQGPLAQLYGDVWEWTASPFMPYPGFRAAPGAVGEYNGKFMNAQFVLRGGSCVTPAHHVRATYRNFFYPHQRWQFTGLRLAKDPSH
jgi:ergothioneine biosynthesis protein EgtB